MPLLGPPFGSTLMSATRTFSTCTTLGWPGWSSSGLATATQRFMVFADHISRFNHFLVETRSTDGGSRFRRLIKDTVHPMQQIVALLFFRQGGEGAVLHPPVQDVLVE